jgi:hypothetical protein
MENQIKITIQSILERENNHERTLCFEDEEKTLTAII